MKYTFSGHETFQCKSLWLKKGVDFVKSGKSFNDADAVVDLGVGKNMVASIKFWLKSFNIIDEENDVTDFGEFIFGDNGVDPFLEDTNTLWLLHFQLVKTYYATIYRQLFINFHKERKDFSKNNLFNFIKRQFADRVFENTIWNENTINKDIATFLKMYVTPDNCTFDDYSALLLNLNLIKKVEKDLFEFNYTTKADIHPLIFLYAIKVVAGDDKVVEYDKLLKLSLVFCLSQGKMLELFQKINHFYPNISFDNSAGEQLFSIKEELSQNDILTKYYS
jgi:hypothetical protein